MLLNRLATIVAGTATISGIFVLLGWFSLPVRVFVVGGVATAVMVALRGRQRGTPQEARAVFSVALLLGMAGLAFAAAVLLSTSGTTDPIRSPWPEVPGAFAILIALLVGATTLAAWKHPRVAAVGVACTLGIASLVALLVYPLGFGFDHFIHAAAEHILAASGALTPPPYTYSAHYGLAALLATLGIPIAAADRILAPLITVVCIVPLASRTLGKHGILALLLVPFFPLAVSTPQATSYAFGLAAALFLARDARWSPALIATTVAALFANPLTGIPMVGIVVTTILFRAGHRTLGTVGALASIVALPIALAIASRIVPSFDFVVGFSLAPVRELGRALRDALTFHVADAATADALTVAHVALPVLWIALTIVGARIARSAALFLPPLLAIGASGAVFLTTTIPTQLAEEQTDFPLRLALLAGILATPLVAIALTALATRARSLSQRGAYVLTLAALTTFTLLLAYPRDDAQTRSGLWSVSSDDIAAVRAIATDAGDAPYVVLANQMLGAAAIRELGFRPSYATPLGELLAFPLPAGGPIARTFWEYVGQDLSACPSPSSRGGAGGGVCPSKETIANAAALVGATCAYVVLHDYWTNFDALASATERIADGEIESFQHLRVFRFNVSNP